MKRKKVLLKSIAGKLAVSAFWLVVWTAIYLIINNRYYIPSLWSTAEALISLLLGKEFWQTILLSLFRILLGLLFGCAAGILLSWLTEKSTAFSNIFKPMLTLLKATPIVSLIMLFWLPFSHHKEIMPILISALTAIPNVWSKLSNGHQTLDRKLLEMAKCFASSSDTYLYVRLPHIFPYFIAGFSSSIGLAWKAGIAAEVLCRPEYSIGKAIYTARDYLETEILFAWVIVVLGLSIVLDIFPSRMVNIIQIRPKVRMSEYVSHNGRSFPVLFDRISKQYGDKTALERLTYTFPNGKITAILGEAGSGKTTLLLIAAGLVHDDDYFYQMPPTAPGMIFCENRLIPTITVRENILFANRGANVKSILKSLSLSEEAERYPHELSESAQRRVAIARAIAFRGGIGIFDDPFFGLDEDTKALCAQALFSAYQGKTVLFVAHDREEAERYGDVILKIQRKL